MWAPWPRPVNLWGEGIGTGVARLWFTNVEHGGSPVDVVQGQRVDLPCAKSVDGKEQEHRVILAPYDRTSVNYGQSPVHIRRAYGTRDF